MLRAAIRAAAVVVGIWGGAAAAAPCPHPYFPLEDGVVLKYRAGKQDVLARFSEAKAEGENAQAKLSVKLGNKDKEGTALATCSKEGVTTDSGGMAVVALQSSGLDVKITESSGMLLLAPEAIKSGKSWTNKVSIELSPPTTVKMPLGMKPTIRTTFLAEATWVADEKVTTPAGTFDAIKLRNKTTAVAGATGSERTMDSFVWFAEGVGLVKIQTGDHVDIELVEIQRPAQAKVEKASVKTE